MCFYGSNDRYSASILVCSGTTPDTNWACFHPHYWQVASIHTDSDRPKGNETHLVNLKTQQSLWLLKVSEDEAQIDVTLTRVWSCFCFCLSGGVSVCAVYLFQGVYGIIYFLYPRVSVNQFMLFPGGSRAIKHLKYAA